MEKAKVIGKEGVETDTAVPTHGKYSEEYLVTEAELEKYRKLQKEYLEFLIEMG